MKSKVRVGTCQTPEIISDTDKALACILRFAKEAERKKVDLLLFSECFLSGYILNKEYLIKNAYNLKSKQFATILKQLENIEPTLVFGIMEKKAGEYFNSAVIVEKGKVIGVYRKTHLIDPNETQLFAAGKKHPIFEIKGLKYGINICYDTQFPEAAKALVDQGAKVLLSPAQNMIRRTSAEKWKDKHAEVCAERAKETGLWFVRSDVTGIRPVYEKVIERVAYGPTIVINSKAEVVAQVPIMTVGMVTADIPLAP